MTILLAAVCCRFAIVAAETERNPEVAASVWPGHPDVLGQEILVGIARAARQRSSMSPATAAEIEFLSQTAPLAPEPFAVKGATALRRGDLVAGERLLLDARKRDPRQRGVRFLLADLYLRQNKILPALDELVVLTQLAPPLTPVVTQMLADYSHSPGAVPRLRAALRARPAIEKALLSKLAGDPRNLGIILALAPPVRPGTELSDWQKSLMASLVQAGQIAPAFKLWQRWSAESSNDLGDLSDNELGSPFTWTLLSSSQGVATAQGRQLDLQFFGQADATLASKIMMLAPGDYQLEFTVLDAPRDQNSVHFVLTCLPGEKGVLDFPLRSVGGPSAVRFQVPRGCEALRFQLKGFVQVYPAEVTLSVSELQVRKLG